MAEFVPLLIPEINPDHTELIKTQQAETGWSGFIVASPNCAVTSVMLPLKIFHDAFGLKAALITTMQALSGAGYPGVPSMAIQDNVIPHISGEEDKLEEEPKKFLGKVKDGRMELAQIKLSAQTNRVPVLDGHLVSVAVKLDQPPEPQAAIETLKNWKPPAISHQLPSSPDRPLIYRQEIDRPQPRLDRSNEEGLAWTVGKVRACNVLDLRFMAISHNTLRGAASGSILNAELLRVQGFLKV
jgi:aspartate-semialdehyde dehydrogenase